MKQRVHKILYTLIQTLYSKNVIKKTNNNSYNTKLVFSEFVKKTKNKKNSMLMRLYVASQILGKEYVSEICNGYAYTTKFVNLLMELDNKKKKYKYYSGLIARTFNNKRPKPRSLNSLFICKDNKVFMKD